MTAVDVVHYAIGAYLLTNGRARWKGVPGSAEFQWLGPGDAPNEADAIARGKQHLANKGAQDSGNATA